MKRVPADTYRTQRRKGVGVNATQITEDDFVIKIYNARNHDTLLFFTSLGRVYSKKVYEIPQAGKTARGKLMENIITLSEGERITAMLPVSNFEENSRIMFLTKEGIISRVKLSEFKNVFSIGKRAIKIRENDELLFVKSYDGSEESQVFIATRNGIATRYNANLVRTSSRFSSGVKGINLKENDEIVSMDIVMPEDMILTVTENAYGKRIAVSEYRQTGRGNVGVINAKPDTDTGKVIRSFKVMEDDEIALISNVGKIIKIKSTAVNIVKGRASKGIKLMKLEENEKIAD